MECLLEGDLLMEMVYDITPTEIQRLQNETLNQLKRINQWASIVDTYHIVSFEMNCIEIFDEFIKIDLCHFAKTIRLKILGEVQALITTLFQKRLFTNAVLFKLLLDAINHNVTSGHRIYLHELDLGWVCMLLAVLDTAQLDVLKAIVEPFRKWIRTIKLTEREIAFVPRLLGIFFKRRAECEVALAILGLVDEMLNFRFHRGKHIRSKLLTMMLEQRRYTVLIECLDRGLHGHDVSSAPSEEVLVAVFNLLVSLNDAFTEANGPFVHHFLYIAFIYAIGDEHLQLTCVARHLLAALFIRYVPFRETFLRYLDEQNALLEDSQTNDKGLLNSLTVTGRKTVVANEEFLSVRVPINWNEQLISESNFHSFTMWIFRTPNGHELPIYFACHRRIFPEGTIGAVLDWKSRQTTIGLGASTDMIRYFMDSIIFSRQQQLIHDALYSTIPNFASKESSLRQLHSDLGTFNLMSSRNANRASNEQLPIEDVRTCTTGKVMLSQAWSASVNRRVCERNRPVRPNCTGWLEPVRTKERQNGQAIHNGVTACNICGSYESRFSRHERVYCRSAVKAIDSFDLPALCSSIDIKTGARNPGYDCGSHLHTMNVLESLLVVSKEGKKRRNSSSFRGLTTKQKNDPDKFSIDFFGQKRSTSRYASDDESYYDNDLMGNEKENKIARLQKKPSERK
uniref:FPL domain-containing protein n=1 Tax=Ascaris lumbricoides TaxID=6252 RepID=A0A0M3I5M9_ASCLU